MFAAVDLGSNSFRLHIGKYENGAIQVIKSAREPNRLAAGLDKDNFLSELSIQTGINALQKLRAVLDAYHFTALRAVATHTLRIARNAQEFLVRAEKALGYPIEIISGEEEGLLVYKGVANVLASDDYRLVVDIGGGSTELVFGRGHEIEQVKSFGVGTVKQSRSFFPGGLIDANSFRDAVISAKGRFEGAVSFFKALDWKAAYGSSGTIRAISEIISMNKIGNGKLTVKNLERLREKMIRSGSVDQLKMLAVKQQRAFSIVAGVSILIGLMKKLNIEVIRPVKAGLRMGIMWDLYLQEAEGNGS